MNFCTNYGTMFKNEHVAATLVIIPPGKVSQNRKYVEDLISKHNVKIRASYTSMNGSVNYKLAFSGDEQRSAFTNIINQTLSGNATSSKVS